MSLFTYKRLTDEKLIETDIRLSLASQSYIYPLGIVEDVLVEISSFIYPVYFIILDIKEDRKRPFIIGTPFSTTAKAEIRSWFHWISFDYRVTLGFGSIAGGLDHVNPVIRLPLERVISRVLGLGDHPNPSVGTSLVTASIT
ncbi:reverse transcriptase domain-containing protein [Tanacetum coccineum]